MADVTSADPAVLVACAHGTRDPAGRRALAQVRLMIQDLRPGLEVLAANVDVQKPAVADVVRRLSEQGRRSVVVPLLLSAGYHVFVDIAEAVGSGAAAGLSRAAGALGPDEALVGLLQRRLAAAGAEPDDAIVLAAAGSSDPRAVGDVEDVARRLSIERGVTVIPAYLAAAAPSVADAVATARASGPSSGPSSGRSVTVASYLLAPGAFADRLSRVGADRVTGPLAPDVVLAEIALRRYDEALDERRPGAPPG
jgi:sirohydrochlorin ferrochelatase